MEKSKNTTLRYYIDLIVVCALAFVSAYMLLPKGGKWATLPFCIVCAVAAGFTRVKWLFSSIIFAISAYFVSSFFVGDFEFSVVCAAFSGVCCLVGCLAAKFTESRKALAAVAAVFLVAIGCAGHFYLFGSPLSAFHASDTLEAYVSENYTDSVKTNGLRYDRAKRLYFTEIYGTNNVTDICTLYSDGTYVIDNYRARAVNSLMSDARLKVQLALRDAYPNGKFSVVSAGISAFPEGKLDVSEQFSDLSRMSFDINVSTALTLDDFASLAGEYIRAVAKAGLRPAHIRVRGGNVGKHFLTVKTLPTSFPAPVSVAFEPEDPFALYVAKKLMK